MTGLVVRVCRRHCALPVASIAETLRMPRIEALPGGPPFVRGAALVRGEALPVVDLGALFEEPGVQTPHFLVTLRMGARRVGLGVDGLLGVRDLGDDPTPCDPLLQDALPECVEQLTRIDGELLAVLGAGWTLPDSVWSALEARPT